MQTPRAGEFLGTALEEITVERGPHRTAHTPLDVESERELLEHWTGGPFQPV